MAIKPTDTYIPTILESNILMGNNNNKNINLKQEQFDQPDNILDH